MQVLNFCDGGPDLLAVAERARRPVWELDAVAELLAEHGLPPVPESTDSVNVGDVTYYTSTK